ncbi:Uncharacterised protein [Bordetella ansorpii]|uniref:Uncharacterized protein n=1 Tax=Bordetella ansorpii TaxID=288768 RepID=A0A157SVF6_9BORD|nr:hypothetical protein [Bordetella ansorpii]SAI74335.1 Uncharacterised protein [Bordetella ansorpii]
MSTIVVARFDSIASARSAAHALVADGFAEEAVSMFHGDSSLGDLGEHGLRGGPELGSVVGRKGAVSVLAAVSALGALIGAALFSLPEWSDGMALAAGGAAGGYIGALLGGLWMVGGLPGQAGGLDSGLFGKAILVAVQVHPAGVPMVTALLRDAGGVQVDQARGPWQVSEHWAPAPKPLAQPRTWLTVAAARTAGARPAPAGRRTQWQP